MNNRFQESYWETIKLSIVNTDVNSMLHGDCANMTAYFSKATCVANSVVMAIRAQSFVVFLTGLSLLAFARLYRKIVCLYHTRRYMARIAKKGTKYD